MDRPHFLIAQTGEGRIGRIAAVPQPRQAAIFAHPNIALLVDIQRAHAFVLLEAARTAGLPPAIPAVGAHPNSAFVVFGERPHVGLHVRYRLRSAVDPAERAFPFGPEPERARAVAKYIANTHIGQRPRYVHHTSY